MSELKKKCLLLKYEIKATSLYLLIHQIFPILNSEFSTHNHIKIIKDILNKAKDFYQKIDTDSKPKSQPEPIQSKALNEQLESFLGQLYDYRQLLICYIHEQKNSVKNSALFKELEKLLNDFDYQTDRVMLYLNAESDDTKSLQVGLGKQIEKFKQLLQQIEKFLLQKTTLMEAPLKTKFSRLKYEIKAVSMYLLIHRILPTFDPEFSIHQNIETIRDNITQAQNFYRENKKHSNRKLTTVENTTLNENLNKFLDQLYDWRLQLIDKTNNQNEAIKNSESFGKLQKLLGQFGASINHILLNLIIKSDDPEEHIIKFIRSSWQIEHSILWQLFKPLVELEKNLKFARFCLFSIMLAEQPDTKKSAFFERVNRQLKEIASLCLTCKQHIRKKTHLDPDSLKILIQKLQDASTRLDKVICKLGDFIKSNTKINNLFSEFIKTLEDAKLKEPSSIPLVYKQFYDALIKIKFSDNEYKDFYREQEIIVALKKWRWMLNKFRKNFPQTAEKRELGDAIRARTEINKKSGCFGHFYSDKFEEKRHELVDAGSVHFLTKTKSDNYDAINLIRLSRAKKEKLAGKIRAIEEELKESKNVHIENWADLISMWYNTAIFHSFDQAYEDGEKLSENITKPMSETFKSYSKNISALIYSGWIISQSITQQAIKPTLLNNISQIFTSDFNNIVTFVRLFGGDEQSAIKALPHIKRSLELAIFIAPALLLAGGGIPTFVYMSGMLATQRCLHYLSEALLKKIVKTFFPGAEANSTFGDSPNLFINLFLRDLVGDLAYSLWRNYLWHGFQPVANFLDGFRLALSEALSHQDVSILFNEDHCNESPTQCKSTAEAVLKNRGLLQKDRSINKTAYFKHQMPRHDDKTKSPEDRKEFRLVQTAKERHEKFLWEEKETASSSWFSFFSQEKVEIKPQTKPSATANTPDDSTYNTDKGPS